MTRYLRALRLIVLVLLPLALCLACSGGREAPPAAAAEPADKGEAREAEPAAAEPADKGGAREAEPAAPALLPQEPAAEAGDRPAQLSQEAAAPEPAAPKRAQSLPEASPYLVIDSPADMSSYGPIVTVAGRVSDSEARPWSTVNLQDLTWVIPGSERGGRIDYREDGSFGFSYSTRGFQGHHFLSVRARSKANRYFEKVIALLDGGQYPRLELTSPADLESCAGEVRVAGRVEADGGLESLSWALSGSDRGGRVEVSAGGAFGFSFSGAGLTGDRTLTLRAVNRQGRSAEAAVRLRGPAAVRVEAPVEVVLTAPAADGSYDSAVVVEGYLRPVAAVRSLTYRLSGGAAEAGEQAGEAAFEHSTGAFSFELDTRELSGPCILELAAALNDGRVARAAVRLEDGKTGPVVDLTAPENNSFYRSSVSVVGRVGNSREDRESADQVTSLSCRLLSDPARRVDIEFDPKTGLFSADFSAAGLRGRQGLEFSAENSLGQRSRTTLTLRDGNLRPALAISYPPPGSAYGAWVSVSGVLTADDGGLVPVEAIRSLTYVVGSAESYDPDTELRGEIGVSVDGRFQFLFPGRSLSGPQQVTVKVEAHNGNSVEASLPLVKGESDFPSFRAVPGDRQVTVSWDPLPLEAAYAVSYTEGAATPAGSPGRRLDAVGTPVVVRGLDNGRLYTFTLSAALAGVEGEYSSSPLESIPLSPHTLTPSVWGEYEKIVVSWPGIPGARAYELWRGVDDPENLQKLAGGLDGTLYEDVEVLYGRTYSYAVRPALPDSVLSRPASAQTLPFPVQKLVARGSNPDVRAVAVSARGAYAFVAAGDRGLSVVDVADPGDPKTVGVLPSFDARAVDCDGTYVYLADGEKGLKVIDVSEPSRPEQVGFRNTSAAQDVRVRGDFAFVADGEMGLKVIDIREPRYPVRAASLETENARGVDLQGDSLFVADGDGGLKVADISDPAHPRLIGAFPLEDVRAVAAGGRYAALAAGEGGVVILDISDPSFPRALGTCGAAEALDVALNGRYLFVADSAEGITVFDIADPARPVPFASLKSEGAAGLAVSGEVAYLARDSGLQLVSVQIEGKSRQLAAVKTPGRAYGLALSGDYAYVADHQEGLEVIDVSRPQALSAASLVGSCDTDYAEDVVVRENIAYVSDGPRGLKIVDLAAAWDSDPATQPRVVGSFDSEGNARGLSLEGDLLFLADGEAGLQILDVSEPGHPVWLAEDSADARDVLVREGQAFVIGSEGLRVLDVKDPLRPRRLGSFATGAGTSLALAADTLFATAASGLWLLDVSDPAAIRRTGFWETGAAEDIFVAGGYAYLAEGFGGLTVLDARDPEKLQRVSSCRGIYAVGVAVRDRHAFVVDSSGLTVIDILIPPWLRE